MSILNKEHLQKYNDDQSLDVAINDATLQAISNIKSMSFANFRVITDTFDALGIDQVIETYVDRVGSHVKVSF